MEDIKKNNKVKKNTLDFDQSANLLQSNSIVEEEIKSNHISEKDKKKLIYLSLHFHLKGNIPKAIKYYKFCISKNINNKIIFINYGAILKNLGNLKEAEFYTRKAIKLDPFFANAFSNLALILRELDNLKEGEFYARKAIKLDPKLAEANSNLGLILADFNNLKEAKFYTQRAIKLNPNIAEPYSNLGNLFRAQGKLKQAELYTRKAIRINSELAEPYSNLGNLLRTKGKLKEAEFYTRKAIQLNPDYGEAHSTLGFILTDLGKLDELIHLSKSTINSKLISDEYKFLAMFRLLISNLIIGNFPKFFIQIQIIKTFIKKKGIPLIKNEMNKKHVSTYLEFLKTLYPLLCKKNKKNDFQKIPHIGESHCLSFAHQSIDISSKSMIIQPVLIIGAKAWHFASSENNQWKDSITNQIENHNYSDEILISFGQIDCLKNEGILQYSIKNKKDIKVICENTVKNYVKYMEKLLSKKYSKRFYFGIPAPNIEIGSREKEDHQVAAVVNTYNKVLKKDVLSKGAYFVDVYSLTTTKEGFNNELYMCDGVHLSPNCLNSLLKEHLYKPK